MDTTHIISDLYALCGAGRIGEIGGAHVNIDAMDRLGGMVDCAECKEIFARAEARKNPSDIVAGHLMVGVAANQRDVVINHRPGAVDADGWEHIVFSPTQAKGLANLLADKVAEIQKTQTPVQILDAILGHVEVGQHALESAMERIANLEELIRKAHGPDGCECFKGTWPPSVVCEAHRDLKALAKELQEMKDDAEASQYDENA